MKKRKIYQKIQTIPAKQLVITFPLEEAVKRGKEERIIF